MKDTDIAKCLKEYDEEQHPSGECLPENQEFFTSKLCHHFSRPEYFLPKLILFEMCLKIMGTDWLVDVQ